MISTLAYSPDRRAFVAAATGPRAMAGIKTLAIDRLSSEANRAVYVASVAYSRADLAWIPVAPSGLGGPSSSICGVPSASTQRTWKSWRPSSNGQS